jgi:hypothetical protein
VLLATTERDRLTDEEGLVSVLREDGEDELRRLPPDGELWILGASLIGEWRKQHPVGPIARWLVRLDSRGRAMREGLLPGLSTMFAFPLDIPDFDERDAYSFTNSLGPSFLGPALFAISLMHCKNVDVRPVDPPERVSRSHERKHGRPLTRYHVLDIQPMRRIFDREGEAHTRGLRHALHICRGHFKTYGPEAPLLGKHTGTYWWPAQVRGTADEGVVEKDYRIRLDQRLGRYIKADEHPEIQPTAPEHTGAILTSAGAAFGRTTRPRTCSRRR